MSADASDDVQQPSGRVRTLPVRRWLALCLVLLFVCPVAVTLIIGVNVSGIADQPDDDKDTARFLRDGAANAQWQDPAWQASLAARLADVSMDAILFVDGNEIFRSSADPLADTDAPSGRGPDFATGDSRSVWKLTIDGSTPPLSAHVFNALEDGPPPGTWVFPVVGILSLATALTLLGWLLGRMLVRPLRETSAIAHEIANGNLDRSLPPSRVREIDTVRQAFDAMRDGLRSSIAQQAAVEQERRLLISAVAHDLRTPLFAIRGYLEGILTGVASTDAQRTRYLQRAQEQAATLERHVSDLFDYARLEYLEQTQERAPFDLADLLLRIVEGQQPRATALGLSLRTEVPDAGCTVVADAHLMTRVLENLLDNALRHTPSGGEIVVSCGGVQEVWFRVSDNGPGIPPADLPHLFAPLFRGDASRNRGTTSGAGGAGLGLTTAQRIMQAHGGTLRAANRTGELTGAVFTGSLPTPGATHMDTAPRTE